MDRFSFESLNVYQEAKSLLKMAYPLLRSFPKHEIYALGNQLQRSILSVSSNIAEGRGRNSYKEKIHFIEIAYGSLLEAYCQMQIALELNYISEQDFQTIKPKFFTVSRLLNALSKSFQQKLNE